MNTSQDDHIVELLQARWREMGLSPKDLADIFDAASATGPRGAAKIDNHRLATLAELLGITADIVDPNASAPALARGKMQAAHALQSVLELRMMRVFREVQNPEVRQILIGLAEQIVRRQPAPGAAE